MMKLNKDKQTIVVNNNTFKYEIIYAFTDGGPKCLTIYRTNEGIEKLPLLSPITNQVMREIKNNDFFKSEVDVDALMFLEHKDFIPKNDSFIMSDLAKI